MELFRFFMKNYIVLYYILIKIYLNIVMQNNQYFYSNSMQIVMIQTKLKYFNI